MKRTLTLACSLFLLGVLFGQEGFVTHHFRCQSDLVGTGEKFILEEVMALEPGARLSLSGNMVKVGLRGAHDRRDVFNALQRSGVCDPVEVRTTTGGTGVPATGADGFPIYQATGDPVQDDAAYDQAKRAWIEANPESYQKLQNSPVEPTSDPE